MVSGSKDGSVIVWNSDLSVRAKYDLLRIPEVPILPQIRSVCMNAFGVVIAGTSSSDMYQLFGDKKSSRLLQAHFQGELCGFCVHPTNPNVFATSGDDKTVRVWNCEEKKLLSIQMLDMPSQTCAFSKDGSKIVCGFGTRQSATKTPSSSSGFSKNGAYVVYESEDMTLVHEDRPSRVAITEIQYSPSGDHIAIASGKCIYIASSLDFQTRSVVQNHKYEVSHFDFSQDSKSLRTNTTENELTFFSAEDGKKVKSASSLKDATWSSTTCPLVWSAQGLHGDLDRVVTSVDRYGSLLASGDVQGHIRLHRFPCVNEKSESLRLKAHGSEIGTVRFNQNGNVLYSVGTKERIVCQWRVKKGKSGGSVRGMVRSGVESTKEKEEGGR
tara:strand:- start:1912 stop:3063 length:1152 start_codon:yes stop_codon:yes gene_type:complete